jgi:hypothetical protein
MGTPLARGSQPAAGALAKLLEVKQRRSEIWDANISLPVSIMFLAYGHFEILGKCPENTQNDVFLGAFNGFLAGEPRLGCRKADFRFLSG